MRWNWQLPQWPQFIYDLDCIAQQEKKFLLSVGKTCAYLKNIDEEAYQGFAIEILSVEGAESSRIEDEFLDREGLQSSIKKQFGLQSSKKKEQRKESQMAAILCDVYRSYDLPLTHNMLWKWHGDLFQNETHIEDRGQYRSHEEPMQIVSNRSGAHRIYFEAPPSSNVPKEMQQYIDWFNSMNPVNSILGRASIAHVYFESVHPFEDGNGRIGRILVEKILSQSVERPILISVSKILEKRKKAYYAALEQCNRTLKINDWLEFFADVILEAQQESMNHLYFLIEKSKHLNTHSGKLNPRQEKVLLRSYEEGPDGFKGGLSADNYIAITQTSRATATRDLADLVEKKALVKTGELRHTRYWLPSNPHFQ